MKQVFFYDQSYIEDVFSVVSPGPKSCLFFSRYLDIFPFFAKYFSGCFLHNSLDVVGEDIVGEDVVGEDVVGEDVVGEDVYVFFEKI